MIFRTNRIKYQVQAPPTTPLPHLPNSETSHFSPVHCEACISEICAFQRILNRVLASLPETILRPFQRIAYVYQSYNNNFIYHCFILLEASY